MPDEGTRGPRRPRPGAADSIIAGIQLGSTLAGGLFKKRAGDQESQVALKNAAQRREEIGLLSRIQTGRSAQLRKENERFTSFQRAIFAKSGVTLEGSPLEVLIDSAADLELDVLTDEFNTAILQRHFRLNAEEEERKARFFRTRGRGEALGTILTGVGNQLPTILNLTGTIFGRRG